MTDLMFCLPLFFFLFENKVTVVLQISYTRSKKIKFVLESWTLSDRLVQEISEM